MSNRDDSNSNYGTESYAPSRNMFQTVDKEGHVPKETLLGEILEGETIEMAREMLARRRWVLVVLATHLIDFVSFPEVVQMYEAARCVSGLV